MEAFRKSYIKPENNSFHKYFSFKSNHSPAHHLWNPLEARYRTIIYLSHGIMEALYSATLAPQPSNTTTPGNLFLDSSTLRNNYAKKRNSWRLSYSYTCGKVVWMARSTKKDSNGANLGFGDEDWWDIRTKSIRAKEPFAIKPTPGLTSTTPLSSRIGSEIQNLISQFAISRLHLVLQ